MSGFEYIELKNNREIKHDIQLIQNAYISDCGKFYKALGNSIDNKGRIWEFELRWPVINYEAAMDETDESKACNWDDYFVISKGLAL